MYCYEAANVMNAALVAQGVNELVDFRYFPVNHIDPSTGAFDCEASLDCESTQFDSCMVATYCNPITGEGCAAEVQLQISDFLACMEGIDKPTIISNKSIRIYIL